MQLISKNILDNAIIPFENAFSFSQPKTSNFCQNQEYKLEIDYKTPHLSYLLDLKLYKIEKPD